MSEDSISLNIPEDYSLDYVSVCLQKEISEDELSDYWDLLEDLERPESFGNQIIDIDSTNPTESKIILSDEDPEDYIPPGQEMNALLIEVSEGDTLHFHIHLDLIQNILIEVSPLLEQVLDIVGASDLNIIGMDLETDMPFEDYELPISEMDDGEVFGVRFVTDGKHYVFQNQEEFDQNEEGTTIRMFLEDETLTRSATRTFIREELQEAIEHIQCREQ